MAMLTRRKHASKNEVQKRHQMKDGSRRTVSERKKKRNVPEIFVNATNIRLCRLQKTQRNKGAPASAAENFIIPTTEKKSK